MPRGRQKNRSSAGADSDYLVQHEAGAYPIVDGVPREAPIPELRAPDDSNKVRASYSRPYVMHASLAPSAAAIALWDADRLTVWSHSQGIELLGPTVAKVLGVQRNKSASFTRKEPVLTATTGRTTLRSTRHCVLARCRAGQCY